MRRVISINTTDVKWIFRICDGEIGREEPECNVTAGRGLPGVMTRPSEGVAAPPFFLHPLGKTLRHEKKRGAASDGPVRHLCPLLTARLLIEI